MDFIDGLPNYQRYNNLWVVVYRLTKYSHFLPLKHTYTTKSIADSFMKNVFLLHGLAQSIVSYRDLAFTSQFWQELFSLLGIEMSMNTSYHPQMDGQVEAVNKVVENYLWYFTRDRLKDWSVWVPLAEWWYNTTQHLSTRVSPYEALYG